MTIDLTAIDPYASRDDGVDPDWHKRRRKLSLERRIARTFRRRKRRAQKRQPKVLNSFGR